MRFLFLIFLAWPIWLFSAATDEFANWNFSTTNPVDTVSALNGLSTNLLSSDLVLGHVSGKGAILFGGTKALSLKNIEGREINIEASTGLALDSDGTYWLGDYVSGNIYHATNSANPFALAILSSFSTASASDLQGVAIDTWDNTLWTSGAASKAVKHFTKSGTLLSNGWTNSFSCNHCAYEPGRSSVWVVEAINPGITQKLHRFNTNGVEQEVVSVTLPATFQVDGIAYDAGNDCLWLGCDHNARADSRLYKVNKTTGALITFISAFTCIEGVAVSSDAASLYYTLDANFHLGDYSGSRLVHIGTNGSTLDRTITNKMSLSVWIKPSLSSSTNYGIISKDDKLDILRDSFSLLVVGSAPYFRLNNTAGTVFNATSGNTVITDTNHWYHLVSTYNGASIVNYLDGIVDKTLGSVTGDIRPLVDEMRVATRTNRVTFPGAISDVRLFSRDLSASEVLSLFNNNDFTNQYRTRRSALARRR